MTTNTEGVLHFFHQVTPQSLQNLSLGDFVRPFSLWSLFFSLCLCLHYFFHPPVSLPYSHCPEECFLEGSVSMKAFRVIPVWTLLLPGRPWKRELGAEWTVPRNIRPQGFDVHSSFWKAGSGRSQLARPRGSFFAVVVEQEQGRPHGQDTTSRPPELHSQEPVHAVERPRRPRSTF